MFIVLDYNWEGWQKNEDGTRGENNSRHKSLKRDRGVFIFDVKQVEVKSRIVNLFQA